MGVACEPYRPEVPDLAVSLGEGHVVDGTGLDELRHELRRRRLLFHYALNITGNRPLTGSELPQARTEDSADGKLEREAAAQLAAGKRDELRILTQRRQIRITPHPGEVQLPFADGLTQHVYGPRQ